MRNNTTEKGRSPGCYRPLNKGEVGENWIGWMSGPKWIEILNKSDSNAHRE
jgi:hypothetical protein